MTPELKQVIADAEAAQRAAGGDEAVAEFGRVSRLDEREQRIRAGQVAITPEMLDRVVRSKLDGHQSVRTAVEWARTSHAQPFLVLLGGTGCGKTVAASALLAALGGRYVQSPELASLLASRSYQAPAQVRELMQARLLIVDDFGTADDAQAEQRALFEAVNGRLRHQRARTVITGNQRPPEFFERAGDRVASRLRALAQVHWSTDRDLRADSSTAHSARRKGK